MTFRTLKVLLFAKGQPLRGSQIAEQLWGNREDGGPLTWDRVVSVQVLKLRKLGVPIGSGPNGQAYRIDPSDIGQVWRVPDYLELGRKRDFIDVARL